MDFAKYGDAYVGLGGIILISVDEYRVSKQRPCKQWADGETFGNFDDRNGDEMMILKLVNMDEAAWRLVQIV